MKQTFVFIILALCMLGCNQHSKHWETLANVESFIEQRPDSALSVLLTIDNDDLSGKEEKAKHALLLSMALDKNYIDTTDFKALQHAIDYYTENGSATDKLRTLYYQGRIFQNRGDDASAMTCFLNALDKGYNSDDILTKARLLVAQGNIYRSLIKWDKMSEANLQASEYFLQANRIDSYINCLLKAINGLIQQEDYTKAKEYLEICKRYTDRISPKLLGKYYSGYLTYLSITGSNADIEKLASEYQSVVPDKLQDYITLSYAFVHAREFDKALETINKVSHFNNIHEEIRYYAVLTDIYEHKKDFEKALENYNKFNELNNSLIHSVFKHDTQFMEEKHELEMQKAKETEAKNNLTIIILLCVIALLTSCYIINAIRKRLKQISKDNANLQLEKARYEQMYNEIVSERDTLNEMLTNATIKEETMTVIRKRLEILNTIVVSHLSERVSDIKRANENLKNLIADKDSFIKSTRLTLEDNYPYFFTYLNEKGLNEHEIDFCCLYAIGMKGKEVKAYTNLNRHYKDSSEVRQKLGLTESDTNLSNFLQKLLKNEQE